MKKKYSRVILYLVFFIIYILAAYYSKAVIQYDEHYQIIEFARYKFGDIKSTELPWEFGAKIRSWFSPYLFYLNLKLLSLFEIHKPEITTFVFRAFHGVFGLFVIFKLINQISFFTKKLKKSILFEITYLSCLFFPMLLVRGSSENESALLFWLGTNFLLQGVYRKKEFSFFLTGIFYGLAFLARYQIAFMIFGAGIWYLVFAKKRFVSILNLIFSFFIILFFGVILDYWGYNEIQFTPYKYFHSNLVENKSEIFGTMPWDGYFTLFKMEFYDFIGLFFLISSLIYIFFFPKTIISFIILPFILVHFYIPHKETRFLFPILYVSIPMILSEFKLILDFFRIRKDYLTIFLLIFNLIFLPIFIFIPREVNFDVIYYLRKNYTSENKIYYNFYNPFKGMNLISIPYFDPKLEIKKAYTKDLESKKEKFVYINYYQFVYSNNLYLEKKCKLKMETPIYFEKGALREILILYVNFFHKEGFQIYECDFRN